MIIQLTLATYNEWVQAILFTLLLVGLIVKAVI